MTGKEGGDGERRGWRGEKGLAGREGVGGERRGIINSFFYLESCP